MNRWSYFCRNLFFFSLENFSYSKNPWRNSGNVKGNVKLEVFPHFLFWFFDFYLLYNRAIFHTHLEEGSWHLRIFLLTEYAYQFSTNYVCFSKLCLKMLSVHVIKINQKPKKKNWSNVYSFASTHKNLKKKTFNDIAYWYKSPHFWKYSFIGFLKIFTGTNYHKLIIQNYHLSYRKTEI